MLFSSLFCIVLVEEGGFSKMTSDKILNAMNLEGKVELFF